MPQIECMGESFEVQSEISAWAFADFAEVLGKSKDDANEFDPATITAMMSLLQDVIVPEEWVRFKTVTRAKRANFEQLMKVVKDTTAAQSGRPTSRPSDSSDGPTVTAPNSGLSSEDRALAASGLRPDLQLAIVRSRDVA